MNDTAPYYQDDSVTLYHGDCIEFDGWWLSADVLVTDPPYGMNSALTRTALDVGIAGDGDTGARDAAIAAWGERPAMVFGHWRRPRPGGVRHLIVWDKVHMALGAATAPYATTHEEVYVMGAGDWVPGQAPHCAALPEPARRPAPRTPHGVACISASMSPTGFGVLL